MSNRGTWTVGLVCGAIAFCLGMCTTNGNGALDRDLARDAITSLRECNDALAVKHEALELCIDVAHIAVDELETCLDVLTAAVYTLR